jgi:hypothetical protein
MVAMDDAGGFVVAFRNLSAIRARSFDSAGTAVGVELQANTYTPASASEPSVAMDGDGDFVVLWRSSGQDDGGLGGPVGRRFGSSGAAVGGEFQVNVYTDGQQDSVAVAMDAAGDFVAVWKDWQQYAIIGRRFFESAGPELDIDGDGELGALTDGLLVLRWLFGFTGATLITGAYDTTNCTRCTAGEMLAHLGSISSQLDIDGDGQLEALTDGLLVLRWLFGFTGATLITGAYDTMNCTRCTAQEIADWIAGLAT